ncbi:MAG: enoyl-CoA hydratase/isomerase family protein [Acidobacteriia bacterium]|nr:enoyl-CoA hydratase/isomerase family protein [Terriglobia bacterium]
MPYTTLQIGFAGEIATITLNRPDKRNAISAAMIADLLAALAEAEANPARILILTGAGKAFCAGMDLEALKAVATQSPTEHLEDSRRTARLYRRLWSFPKPTIAAVNGPAVAGGCGLATLCDFTIAAPEAKFGYPEVRIGFIPAIVSVFLTRQIGEKRARDLLLTGRIIDAAEALNLGLINEIAPTPELMGAAHRLAKELLYSSPLSLLKTKKLLRDSAAPELDRELELAIAESAQMRSTEDFREGLTSFLEKRAPRWVSK